MPHLPRIEQIFGLSAALESLGFRWHYDYGNCVAFSMQLISLTYQPTEPDKMLVYINGMLLKYVTDYTVDGVTFQTINATVALNTAYGGAGSNGAGFDSNDTVEVVYRY